MPSGFWSTLKRPVYALAPMADVTDAAFRRLIAKYGKPDVLFTEFTSADGLCHEEGRKKLLTNLAYSRAERPIVAQLFTGRPETMREAAKLVRALGFDGIDINMGCPDRAVEKQGAGASLMKDPKRARELIRAAREGAGPLPVSVKTRLGYNKDELERWLPELLAEAPAVVTIHARTRKELSDVPARWDRIAAAVALRDRGGFRTLIFGNGDAQSLAEARTLARESGADGVMLGRAIFGNPFLFASGAAAGAYRADVRRRLAVMLEHTKLFERLFLGSPPVKNFSVMKKHYKAYVAGWEGAKELRIRLMAAERPAEVEKIVGEFLRGGAF